MMYVRTPEHPSSLRTLSPSLLSHPLSQASSSDSQPSHPLSQPSIKAASVGAPSVSMPSVSAPSIDVVIENEFEKELLANVIPPSDIRVTFDDIGVLENVKDTLKELVMLSLRRPERFSKGQLAKVGTSIFSLASKIAPSVIFVDEVDSMLGRRETPGKHETMCKMKNEFMMNWDGLQTKDKERVFVLPATNRPFNLDEAVIRGLLRR
ncbi:hypothetical protein S245_017782 [Arachis hypogaea]